MTRSALPPTMSIVAALAAGGVLASACASGDAVPDGLDVSYLEVDADETWTDLATRIIPCDDGEPDPELVDEVATYLQDTNPAIADAGLAARQLLTFAPDRIPGDCVAPPTTIAATADPSDAASADEPLPRDEAQLEGEPVGQPDGEGGVTTGGSAPTDLATAFVETFDDPASLERFQWQLHHGVSFEQSVFSWKGDHDENCGKPSTTRTIEVTRDIVLFPEGMGDLDRYGNFVYWCAPGGAGSGHMMTSFDTEGYAQIAFSPDQPFDDVQRVCWDQNQTDLGARKWTQLVIVPESTYVMNDRRLDYVSPAFQDGPGAGGLRLSEDVFLFELLQGSTVLSFGQDARVEDFAGFVTEDKVRRYSTCATDLGNGTIEIALEREDHTEIRTFAGSFPSGAARVIFQDDSYNPPKAPGAVPDPFTWHWDNITIETS